MKSYHRQIPVLKRAPSGNHSVGSKFRPHPVPPRREEGDNSPIAWIRLRSFILVILVCGLVRPTQPLGAAEDADQAAPATPAAPVVVPVKNEAEDAGRAEKQEEAQEREREQKERDQERAQEKLERDKEHLEQARERADHLYEKAARTLDKREWPQAIAQFDELIKQGGDRSEGAYYWKAYAQSKEGKREDALATLAQLSKVFPQSRWLNDARELEVEVRQAGGQSVNPEGQPDDELKLMALNGLSNADPEKALPLIQKLLKSGQPLKIKEQALFVLSQSGSPKARETLAEFARGAGNPDLQMKSLEFLALFGGKESRQLLATVYAASDDLKVKRAILGYFMMGGDRDRLFAVAKEEKDPALRREAIGQLGMLGAKEELARLYEIDSDPEAKKKILEAMFVGGNADQLVELARNEKDPGLRRKAIEMLGPMGSEKTGAGLVALYDLYQDPDLRKKVIEALFAQGNGKALVEIARKETNPALRKKAIEQLSAMNSKEGTDYFMELLNK